MEVVFQQVIAERTAQGTSVLLSSHILAQVEVLSDRLSIIRGGQIVESGSLAELRHMTRTTVEVETEQLPERLSELEGVHEMRLDPGSRRAVVEVDAEHLGTTLQYLTSLGVRSLTAHPPTLEQLLIRHYGAVAGDQVEGADPRSTSGSITAEAS